MFSSNLPPALVAEGLGSFTVITWRWKGYSLVYTRWGMVATQAMVSLKPQDFC